MNWFARRWWAGLPFRRTGVREADPADMGTAFGLDASLERLDPNRPTLDPIGAVPMPSWEDRLVRRSAL